MARVKKEMSKIRLKADSRLLRDRLLESKEAIAEVIGDYDSIVTPSSLELFTNIPFPKLGSTTPRLFQASYFTDKSREYLDFKSTSISRGVISSSLNLQLAPKYFPPF